MKFCGGSLLRSSCKLRGWRWSFCKLHGQKRLRLLCFGLNAHFECFLTSFKMSYNSLLHIIAIHIFVWFELLIIFLCNINYPNILIFCIMISRAVRHYVMCEASLWSSLRVLNNLHLLMFVCLIVWSVVRFMDVIILVFK